MKRKWLAGLLTYSSADFHSDSGLRRNEGTGGRPDEYTVRLRNGTGGKHSFGGRCR